MDLITFAEAIELFKLPRKLGLTAAGESIIANTGRFGPYVKYGAKYVSLKTDDPYEISPERALEVIREKEVADANRLIMDFPDAKIQVLNGRYGPYITDKERNAKIPKDKDPKSLSLEECRALLAAAPVRSFGRWGKKNAKGAPKRGSGKAAAATAAPPNTGGAALATAPKTAKGSAAQAKARGARKTPSVESERPVPSTARAPAPPAKLAAKASKSAANKKAPAQPSSKAIKPRAAKLKAPKSSVTHET
jgi:DNA topoisomerase-1